MKQAMQEDDHSRGMHLPCDVSMKISLQTVWILWNTWMNFVIGDKKYSSYGQLFCYFKFKFLWHQILIQELDEPAVDMANGVLRLGYHQIHHSDSASEESDSEPLPVPVDDAVSEDDSA